MKNWTGISLKSGNPSVINQRERRHLYLLWAKRKPMVYEIHTLIMLVNKLVLKKIICTTRNSLLYLERDAQRALERDETSLSHGSIATYPSIALYIRIALSSLLVLSLSSLSPPISLSLSLSSLSPSLSPLLSLSLFSAARKSMWLRYSRHKANSVGSE